MPVMKLVLWRNKPLIWIFCCGYVQ